MLGQSGVRSSKTVIWALLAAMILTACGESFSQAVSEDVFRADLSDPTENEAELPENYAVFFERDQIIPVYEPTFVAASDVGWPEDEVIIGIDVNGEQRAYPVGFLSNREIVNDSIDNRPILVTWCPLCGSALVHRREIDGRAVLFGNQGDLWNNAMTLFDHDTGSVWSQVSGSAILGELEGTTLELLPSELANWSDWVTRFPDTQALATDTATNTFRIRNLTVVARVGDDTAGIEFEDLRALGSISTELAGTPVVFVGDPVVERWAVFSREVDGVERQLDLVDGALEDPMTGDRWNPGSGISLSGQASLQRIPTFSSNFANFVEFFPDGQVLVQPDVVRPVVSIPEPYR